jgi:predicted dehydrogenase
MGTDKGYRVCLVGAAADIAREHVHAIEVLPYFSLEAVCDLNRDRLKEKYPYLPDDALFTDYITAVNMKGIDVVVNATPNELHGPVSIAALKAGKAVLCEKPMTHNLESARQLLDVSNQYQNLFVVSYHFKFFPEVQQFYKERERFGTIKHFRFISSEDLDTSKKWILDQTQGGPWLDWAPNALSVLRQVLSNNEYFDSYAIQDVSWERSPEYAIELKAKVQLTLNAVPGNITVDWLAPKGSFTAKTILINQNETELILNHATSEILVNGKRYWSGEDQRYIDVYKDFHVRLNTCTSNIHIGMQDMEIIQAVQERAYPSDYKNFDL